jgi:ribosome biogenesis GTPase
MTDQQSARIEKKQKQYRQHTSKTVDGPTAEGLIISRFRLHALVESNDGRRIHCAIRPSIDSLVAGDKVIWQIEGKNQGVVVSRYPRESILGRPDQQGQLKPVAANITQMIIVVAAKPDISWPLLDSYLIVAEYLKLRPCILFNKIDLPCDENKQRLLEEYQPLGYTLLFTSQKIQNGLEPMQQLLRDQISVFVGQSGVGKSSLIGAVLPDTSNIQTGPISARTHLGTHTTSHSCFYHLPSGGALIDSPGVRQFGLWHMPRNALAKCYREFQPFLSKCKFRDCNHIDAPGCQIIQALNQRLITQHRYENYVKIASQFSE